MSRLQQGFLLIADITGYTMYLSQSELEHAHEVLQTLLELLIEHTRPPLVISRLAGDAVISYGLQDDFLSGQTFVEMLEDTYVSFRRAIELMVLNNTCRCNACANIANLDLKFFVHHGTFTLQKLDAHEELVGTDVNTIHRLLKNRVAEETGFRAYALYSDAAVRRLGLEGIAKTMTAHRETYEHIGDVQAWVQDLAPVWAAKKDEARIVIEPAERLVSFEKEVAAPVTLAWEAITDGEYRALLFHSLRQETRKLKDGRLAPGSEFQCYHGDGRITVQTILEWVPFEQVTTLDTTPVPKTNVLIHIKLAPSAGGTTLRVTVSKARGPFLNRIMCDLVGRYVIPRDFGRGFEAFRRKVEADLAGGVTEPVHPGEAHIHEAIEAELGSGR